MFHFNKDWFTEGDAIQTEYKVLYSKVVEKPILQFKVIQQEKN